VILSVVKFVNKEVEIGFAVWIWHGGKIVPKRGVQDYSEVTSPAVENVAFLPDLGYQSFVTAAPEIRSSRSCRHVLWVAIIIYLPHVLVEFRSVSITGEVCCLNFDPDEVLEISVVVYCYNVIDVSSDFVLCRGDSFLAEFLP